MTHGELTQRIDLRCLPSSPTVCVLTNDLSQIHYGTFKNPKSHEIH